MPFSNKVNQKIEIVTDPTKVEVTMQWREHVQAFISANIERKIMFNCGQNSSCNHSWQWSIRNAYCQCWEQKEVETQVSN